MKIIINSQAKNRHPLMLFDAINNAITYSNIVNDKKKIIFSGEIASGKIFIVVRFLVGYS